MTDIRMNPKTITINLRTGSAKLTELDMEYKSVSINHDIKVPGRRYVISNIIKPMDHPAAILPERCVSRLII